MFGRNTGKLLKGPTMGAHTIHEAANPSACLHALYSFLILNTIFTPSVYFRKTITITQICNGNPFLHTG